MDGAPRAVEVLVKNCDGKSNDNCNGRVPSSSLSFLIVQGTMVFLVTWYSLGGS